MVVVAPMPIARDKRRGQREDRIANEQARRVSNVAQDRVEERAGANVAHLPVSPASMPPSREQRRASGFRRRLPSRQLLVDEQLERCLQFVVEIAFDAIATQDVSQE